MAASGHDKPSQNANEIGWAFVPQYYNFVNKDPARLHCFYTKQSALIHSTEGEEAPTCYGQQEIHQKIMSIGFDDCKVFVSTVDSMSSADSGIIVQVLGEICNANGPWRKFAQTFFLAEQPNGFFVLNDIFRYLKEPEDDLSEGDAEQVPAHAEAASTPTPSSPAAVASVATANAAHETEVVSTNQDTTPYEIDPVDEAAPASIQAEPLEEPKTNGFQDAAGVEAAGGTPQPGGTTSAGHGVEVVAPAEAPSAIHNSTAAAPPNDAPEAAPTESKRSGGNSFNTDHAPAPATSVTFGTSTVTPSKTPEPPQPPVPSAPKTWASLAASGKSKWSGNLSASQGVSSAPTFQSGSDSRSVTPSVTPTFNNPGAAGSSGTRRDDRYLPIDSINTGSCFIKGVNESVDERILRETLVKKFGAIKELDVVRTKACAFLEFERVESAKKAIQASMPYHMGGEGGIQIGPDNHVINIESKRQPGERGRPADAGPKRGGIGNERGGGLIQRGGFTGRGRGGDGGDRGNNRGGRGRGGPGRGGPPNPPQK